MNIKQVILLCVSAWAAWGFSDHVLAESVRGFFDGATPAHKAHSNQVMKTLLLTFFFAGFLLSLFKTAGWFDAWKHTYFSQGLKGAGLGIAAFNIFAVKSFLTVALLVLYIGCFGAGHGIGILAGNTLKSIFSPEKTG
jgi:hypothetical protein